MTTSSARARILIALPKKGAAQLGELSPFGGKADISRTRGNVRL